MSDLDKGTIIEPAVGKLGVLLVGLGAVSTTFIAGVEAIRRDLAKPIGSMTQMGTIRLGKRTENRTPLIKDFVPLASLHDIEFLAWDIFEDIDILLGELNPVHALLRLVTPKQKSQLIWQMTS